MEQRHECRAFNIKIIQIGSIYEEKWDKPGQVDTDAYHGQQGEDPLEARWKIVEVNQSQIDKRADTDLEEHLDKEAKGEVGYIGLILCLAWSVQHHPLFLFSFHYLVHDGYYSPDSAKQEYCGDGDDQVACKKVRIVTRL